MRDARASAPALGSPAPWKGSPIGAAATSEFALLPNPNPSGNFTKVTQRLPVRIAVEQVDGMLRPGMMVEVFIKIEDELDDTGG